MNDWLEDLTPDERDAWDSFVDHTRRDALGKMTDSAFVVSLVPRESEVDIKFAVELGLAIMLDKPILAIVSPGTRPVPEHLVRVADVIVDADVDVEEGRRRIAAAIAELQQRAPR